MIWSAPAAFWFALSLGVIFLLHGIRRFRRRLPTTTLHVWRDIAKESHTSLRLERIVRNLPLLFQLLLAALLVLALAQPLWFQEVAFDKDLVLIVDASASMKARDGGTTRFELAREKAREVIAGLGTEQRMALVAMGAEPRLLHPFTAERSALESALEALEPSDAPARLGPAVSFALSVAKDLEQRQVALIGDGAYHDDAEAVARLNEAVTFLPVPAGGGNVGIVQLAHREYLPPREGGELLVTVGNQTEIDIGTTLLVTVNDQPVARRPLQVAAGAQRHEIVAVPAGAAGVIHASLDAGDAFATDNEGYAITGAGTVTHVLLVGADAPALRAALSSLPDTRFTWREKLNGEVREGALPDYDLAVFNGVAPPPLRQGTLALIGVAAPLAGVTADGWVDAPKVAGWRPDEPLLRYVEPSALDLPRALRLTPAPGTETLLAGVEGPLIVRREAGALRAVTFGFDLAGGGLAGEDALPLLMANLVQWARPRAGETRPSAPGQPLVWRPRPGESGLLTVEGPGGRRWEYELDGAPVVFAHTDVAGLYRFRTANRVETVPVNLLSSGESRIGANPEVIGRPASAGESRGVGEIALEGWYWFVLAGAVFLFVEWVIWNRFA